MVKLLCLYNSFLNFINFNIKIPIYSVKQYISKTNIANTVIHNKPFAEMLINIRIHVLIWYTRVDANCELNRAMKILLIQMANNARMYVISIGSDFNLFSLKTIDFYVCLQCIIVVVIIQYNVNTIQKTFQNQSRERNECALLLKYYSNDS